MGLTFIVVLLISGRKILKSAWFNHAYCGLALGFPKDHLTRDSYARCLLCRQDVKIGSRGITTFFEHCRGVRHHRLDCLTRLRRGLPLRRRDGTLMSQAEADVCGAALLGESVPLIETCPDVTVLEALQIEASDGSVWGTRRVAEDDDHTDSFRLFVCLVIDAIYRDCNFASVRHLWDLMVASNSQHAVMFGATCRESDVLVIMNLFRMHEIITCCMYCYLYVTCETSDNFGVFV